MKNTGLQISIIVLALQLTLTVKAGSADNSSQTPEVNSEGTVLPNLSLIQSATLMEVMQELSKPGNKVLWLCGQDIFNRLQNRSNKKLTPECRSELNRIMTKENESADTEILQLSTFINRQLVTNEQKVKAIYQWVTQNIAYDVETYVQLAKEGKVFLNSTEMISPKNTIKHKMALAEGYSILTAALLRAANIPAVTIVGVSVLNGSVQGTHAWNEVFLDGRWVNLDTTWDAGVVKGNLTTGLVFESKPSLNFYDMSDAEFKKTHRAIIDIR